MYVELYKTFFEKIDQNLPDIESNNILRIVPTKYLIQTNYIVTIAIEPTVIENKKYHHVELATYNFQRKFFVTEKDYDRIAHAPY